MLHPMVHKFKQNEQLTALVLTSHAIKGGTVYFYFSFWSQKFMEAYLITIVNMAEKCEQYAT